MASIKWCFKAKSGIEIVESNNNMSISYLRMSEESLRMISKNEESKIWTASTSYYAMYYSLYSLMMKIGVKCEIHQCSIEFMKIFLSDFYNSEDIKLIKTAFDVRNDLQYYPGRLADENKLNLIKKNAADFFLKTKDILVKINNVQINEIRKKAEAKRDETKKR